MVKSWDLYWYYWGGEEVEVKCFRMYVFYFLILIFMFDKLNIFINNEKKEEPSKNLLVEIFSNKYEIAIITFLIYLAWVLYQIFKLIWWFKVSPVLGNLYFFNFWNTINDFLIIFWYTFLMFIFSFLIVFPPNYLLDKFVYLKGKSKIFIWFWFLIAFLIVLWLIYYVDSNIFNNFNNLFIVIVPYFISVILTIFIIIKKWISKSLFYVFFWLFFIYWFFWLLYWSGKYYWCLNVMENTDKDCILIDYKNDKYWFTWKGDVYNLNEFKSFYTSDYFKNQSNSWSLK